MRATVSTEDDNPCQTFVGLTANSFKTRYSNYKASFCNSDKRHSTKLSKYLWYLKENMTKFKVARKILKQAAPYNPTSNRCNPCPWKKYFIISKPALASLRKRTELLSSRIHAGKYALKSFILVIFFHTSSCHATNTHIFNGGVFIANGRARKSNDIRSN